MAREFGLKREELSYNVDDTWVTSNGRPVFGVKEDESTYTLVIYNGTQYPESVARFADEADSQKFLHTMCVLLDIPKEG